MSRLHSHPPTRNTAAASLTVPVLLAVLGPLTLIASLELLHSVWWAIAGYQFGVCLLAPAVESRLAGRSWREHADLLGLGLRPDQRIPGAGWRHATCRVALVGVFTFLVTGGFLAATRDRFLDPARLAATVADWGVSPDNLLFMLGVMAMINAPAEELFWRGYWPGKVALSRPGRRPAAAVTIVLPAFLYASYHVLTIADLAGRLPGVLVMTGGVLTAGLVWGWLRQRTGSVWPALASHVGAGLAYLLVYFWLVA